MGIRSWAKERANYLLYGPGGSTSRKRRITEPLTTPPAMTSSRSSLVFDSHVVNEAAGSGKNKTPQTVSLAWDERGRYGFEDVRSSWTGMTSLERKTTLLNIYLANPWVSACVDVIAARICSGGFTVEKIDESGPDNDKHHDTLWEFCLRTNDDWDLLQFARASITDYLIFGEAYSEIVWSKGLPYQLFSIDCLTMDYKIDQYGRVERFKQQLQSNTKANWLDPANIIRWWRPHPRAKIDPFSPIEKIQDAIWLDKTMVNWQQKFFKKGARFPYYLRGVGGADEAQRYKTYFEEENTGSKNAHTIPILWGEAELVPLGNSGSLQLDFDKGLDRMRTIVFAGYQVPPAAVSIIESGNIGGGTGEDQDKSLQNNACDPVKGVFLEKLNDRIVKRGFGITDYRIGLRYAEYRSDEQIAKVQDMRLKSGLRTPNEIRQEDGKMPYNGYGDEPIIVVRDITPLRRVEAMQGEQQASAEAALELAQANAELAKVQVEKAKEPPEPAPALLQQANQPEQLNNTQQSDTSKETPEEPQAKEPEEEQESAQEADYPTAMFALMLDPEVAQQLAIPGCEKPEDLHITLAIVLEDQFLQGLDRVQQALRLYANLQSPLQGRIAGLGRFDREGKPSAVIALPDIPDLPAFRQGLLDVLSECGIVVNKEHGYTPHITLAYIDASASMPVESVPELELFFDSFSVCFCGGMQIVFPLQGPVSQAIESQEAVSDLMKSDAPRAIWVGPDIDAQLQQLRDQGVTFVQWGCMNGACDQCTLNDKVTVRLGERFPTGHQLPPGHPNCECKVTYLHGEQEESEQIDPDDTQEMKAVKL